MVVGSLFSINLVFFKKKGHAHKNLSYHRPKRPKNAEHEEKRRERSKGFDNTPNHHKQYTHNHNHILTRTPQVVVLTRGQRPCPGVISPAANQVKARHHHHAATCGEEECCLEASLLHSLPPLHTHNTAQRARS